MTPKCECHDCDEPQALSWYRLCARHYEEWRAIQDCILEPDRRPHLRSYVDTMTEWDRGAMWYEATHYSTEGEAVAASQYAWAVWFKAVDDSYHLQALAKRTWAQLRERALRVTTLAAPHQGECAWAGCSTHVDGTLFCHAHTALVGATIKGIAAIKDTTCECGAEKARTTHARWCPMGGGLV